MPDAWLTFRGDIRPEWRVDADIYHPSLNAKQTLISEYIVPPPPIRMYGDPGLVLRHGRELGTVNLKASRSIDWSSRCMSACPVWFK